MNRFRSFTRRTWRLLLAAALALPGAARADLLVTDLRGPVVRSGAAEPPALLETLPSGTVLRLPAGSRMEFFEAATGLVHAIAGPAVLVLTPQGPRAEQGALAPPRRVGDALRQVKVTKEDVVQGSLRMRGSDALAIDGPEGEVSADAARELRWRPRARGTQVEITSAQGEVIHRASASSGRLVLPAEVRLQPGVRYAWSLSSGLEGHPPLDWTEFVIRDGAPAPPPGAGATEWRLHSVALRAAGLKQAAARAMARAVLPENAQ